MINKERIELLESQIQFLEKQQMQAFTIDTVDGAYLYRAITIYKKGVSDCVDFLKGSFDSMNDKIVQFKIENDNLEKSNN